MGQVKAKNDNGSQWTPTQIPLCLVYCLNLLLQLIPMNSAKFRLLNTKWKEKTTNLILQDLSAKKCETPRHKNHSKTRLRVPLKILPRFLRSGQNFLRPTFFKVPFYTPVIGKNLRVNKWPKLRGNKIESPVQSRGQKGSLSCDPVINIPAKLLYGELTLLS